MILNVTYVIIEFTMGLLQNSMALLADAGHNLSDVFSLILSYVAFRITALKPNSRFTFGYGKTTILASFLNSLLLIIASIFIIINGIKSFSHPHELQGITISIVSFVGIIINSVTAYLFLRQAHEDINMKGAYLHMFTDALVSLGVLISGIVIYFTHFYYIDIFIGVSIGIIIIISSWGVFRESFIMLTDGVPEKINSLHVRKDVARINGVKDIYDLHIWNLSTQEISCILKVSLHANVEVSELKKQLHTCLGKYHIEHLTLEII